VSTHDFGPEFGVVDISSDKPQTSIIGSIANDNPPLASYFYDEWIQIQHWNFIVFF